MFRAHCLLPVETLGNYSVRRIIQSWKSEGRLGKKAVLMLLMEVKGGGGQDEAPVLCSALQGRGAGIVRPSRVAPSLAWAGPTEALFFSAQLPAVLPAVLTRERSLASLHNSTIRSPIFQLMLHSLDPLGEGK